MDNTQKKFLFTLCLFFATVAVIHGQDYSFSQFYANPLYVNPSLAGASECSELHIGYRNQWPALGKSFVNTSASADFNIDRISGAVGVLINSDRAGEGGLKNLGVNLIYSHRVRLMEDMYLNGAIQMGVFNRSIDFSKLVFYDQIDINTGTGVNQPFTSQILPDASFTVPDISSGLTIINKNMYAGVALHHMNTPRHEFYADNSTNFTLPMRITIHAGAVLPLMPGMTWNSKPELEISPNVMYQKQGEFQQLNFGVYLTHRYLTSGLWFRHTLKNPDALIVMFGIDADRVSFGYSYDIYLNESTSRFGGSHELSLGIKLNCSSKKKYGNTINWPVF